MRRTSMAGLITRIGDEAPDNLWLSELRLEDGNDRWKMYLEGAAVDERYLATYLERLERSPLVRDVRLVLSELRSSAMLLPASTGTERELVRFEIEMTVPTLAATEGGT